jgi:hypothetical protein
LILSIRKACRRYAAQPFDKDAYPGLPPGAEEGYIAGTYQTEQTGNILTLWFVSQGC